MRKEKFDEITELSDDIYNSFQHIARSDNRNIAESLYNDGWRKQSEGEWLHDTKWDTFYCSICGESALNDCYEHQILSGYCPHCGAKMKGV